MIGMGLTDKIMASLFGFKPVRRVIVDSGVMEGALEIARNSHPRSSQPYLRAIGRATPST